MGCAAVTRNDTLLDARSDMSVADVVITTPKRRNGRARPRDIVATMINDSSRARPGPLSTLGLDV